MKDIGIFLSGIVVKSAIGYFVGSGIRRAEPLLKETLENEREDYIKAHIFESHQEPFKWCQTNQCASL